MLTSAITDLSNNALGTVLLSGMIKETIFGRTSATELGTWNTQITSLDLTGTFGGKALQAVQDTDNPSLGQTTIAALGNQFQITSFFDIFADIELATVPPTDHRSRSVACRAGACAGTHHSRTAFPLAGWAGGSPPVLDPVAAGRLALSHARESA